MNTVMKFNLIAVFIGTIEAIVDSSHPPYEFTIALCPSSRAHCPLRLAVFWSAGAPRIFPLCLPILLSRMAVSEGTCLPSGRLHREKKAQYTCEKDGRRGVQSTFLAVKTEHGTRS